MNLFDIGERYHISLAKLRKLHKDGLLICDEIDNPLAGEMRYYLARRQPLTVKHLVALLEEPESLALLGNHRAHATRQLEALGSPVEPAPVEIGLEASGAAMNDPDAVSAVMQWAQSIIPAGTSVSHHFLAVRLLLGVEPALRKYEIPRLARAFLNLRQREEFAGWWHTEKQGSRTVTLYHRPANYSLDL